MTRIFRKIRESEIPETKTTKVEPYGLLVGCQENGPRTSREFSAEIGKTIKGENLYWIKISEGNIVKQCIYSIPWGVEMTMYDVSNHILTK